MKNNLQKNNNYFFLQKYFIQNIIHMNFVRNICEFYNFVEDDYLRKNYLSIKTLGKNDKKKSFLQYFMKILQEKLHEYVKISSSGLCIMVKTKFTINSLILWIKSQKS